MEHDGSEQSPAGEGSIFPDAPSPALPEPGPLEQIDAPVAEHQIENQIEHPIEQRVERRRRPLEWLKSELAISKGLEADRWSHRRGEPRTFAFLWAIYLMVGSIIALGIVLAGGIITLDAYQPLSRALVVTLTLGMLVFWPVIRLSQAAPEEGSLVAILKDLAIVLVPLQAVLWPQMYLARWTVNIVLATSLAMIAWAMITGAILAIAMRRNDTWRSAWMVAMLLLAFGGAAFAVLCGWTGPDLLRPHQPGAAPQIVLASGVGLVADISADRSWSGSWALALPEHWKAIRWTFVFAGLAWLLAFWMTRSQRRIEYTPPTEAFPAGIAGGNVGAGYGGGLPRAEGLDSGGAAGGPENPVGTHRSDGSENL